jgi:hypothetical protein
MSKELRFTSKPSGLNLERTNHLAVYSVMLPSNNRPPMTLSSSFPPTQLNMGHRRGVFRSSKPSQQYRLATP